MRAPFEPVRFLVPLAVLGAVAAFASRETTAAAESLFLGEISTAVLLAVAALALAPAFELGLGAVLAVTAVWGLPPGPGRGAAVMLLLTATFLIAAVRRLSRTLPDLPLSVSIPLALGLQLLLRSELLFEPPGLRTLVALLVLPVAGGVAMAVLASRHGGDLALIAAGIAVLPGPGWNVTTTLGLIAVTAVSLVLPRSPGLARLRPVLLPLTLLLAGTALLDAYPWKREEPLKALFAPGGLLTPGTSLLPPETSVFLDSTNPSREKELPAGSISSLILETALSNGAKLENGTPVAVLSLTDGSGRTFERTIRAGVDTGEWAAKRGDVLRTARLRSPEPWITWIAGNFLAQRYRLRWDLGEPKQFIRARIARSPGLPPDVSLAVHQLELRRAPGWPLAPEDPFRGTLLALPLILAGLALVHRMAVRRGAEPLDRAGTAGELAALVVLVLLVLARQHLNLGKAEEVLAAGLALLLACRVARQVVALRPLLGERLPDRPAAVFFLLPLVAYLAVLPWSAAHRQPDGDEPWYLLITHSLAYDLDADLTNNYAREDWRRFMDRPIAPQPGDPVGPKGQLYSRHNEALPLALVPAYRLGGKTGALATMAALTAALAWTTLRLARRYFPDHPGETLAAWSIFTFAPPLLLYSGQVWVEVPATLLLVVALDRTLGLDRRRRWDWAEWIAIGLPVLLLPLIKMRLMLLAVPLVALAWWHAGRPRKPILFLGGLLGALGAGILFYNHRLYGNPFKIHTLEEIDPQRHTWLDYLSGGLGLFWDTAFGLFGAAPIWMLLLPALLLLLARRSRLPVHLAVLVLPYLAIVVPRMEWYGGWSPPFRYALVALPLLGLALVPLLERRGPGARALIAGLGALTLALTLAWLVVPGWTYSFANGRTYPLDHLSERLGTDLARFFPSSVRPRPATWIWPPVSLALVTLVWWLPRRKEGGGFREGAALAGLVAVLLSAAALPLAAARVPTRAVELEDPQVWKSGGHIHPELWIIERTRHRGGWVLRIGETLKAPVEPGGERVTIELQAELIRNQPVPFRLDVRAGDRLLAVWAPGRSRVWETITLGPFDWPEGEPLVLAAYGPHPPGALNGVILDRVVLRWE
ncbi:MAG TPA: hypothetical protein VN493_07135 [Thermoanaerobaculia bacterium]|nr:hypothetical protein [Thermoanaerobaculia bacterium]